MLEILLFAHFSVEFSLSLAKSLKILKSFDFWQDDKGSTWTSSSSCSSLLMEKGDVSASTFAVLVASAFVGVFEFNEEAEDVALCFSVVIEVAMSRFCIEACDLLYERFAFFELSSVYSGLSGEISGVCNWRITL